MYGDAWITIRHTRQKETEPDSATRFLHEREQIEQVRYYNQIQWLLVKLSSDCIGNQWAA